MAMAAKLILCVEDDFDTQEMLGLLLRQRGYQFKAVSTCAAARQALAEAEVALILLDNLLGDGNGIDLCREIRQSGNAVPIVFLSGAVYRNEPDEALRAGADAFITKPFALPELFDALARYAPLTEG